MNKQQLLSQCHSNLLEALHEWGMPNVKTITGDGNYDADIVMVGEAPGANEIKQGRPFVGAAGKNLTSFLETLQIKRADIYITNVVKYRPTAVSPKSGRPVNRTPSKEEISRCAPFVFEELRIINPKIVVTLGNIPLKAITGDDSATVGKVHGQVVTEGGLSIFPLYHPASIIYNQSLKDVYIEDLHKLKTVIHTL